MISMYENSLQLVRDLQVYLTKVLVTDGTLLADHELNGAGTDAFALQYEVSIA